MPTRQVGAKGRGTPYLLSFLSLFSLRHSVRERPLQLLFVLAGKRRGQVKPPLLGLHKLLLRMLPILVVHTELRTPSRNGVAHSI